MTYHTGWGGTSFQEFRTRDDKRLADELLGDVYNMRAIAKGCIRRVAVRSHVVKASNVMDY
jgi:hypothetical protein